MTAAILGKARDPSCFGPLSDRPVIDRIAVERHFEAGARYIVSRTVPHFYFSQSRSAGNQKNEKNTNWEGRA